MRKLLETRDKLRDLLTKVDRSDDLEKILEQVLQNSEAQKKLQGELGETGRRLEQDWQHAGRQGVQRAGVTHTAGSCKTPEPIHDGEGSLAGAFVEVQDAGRESPMR